MRRIGTKLPAALALLAAIFISSTTGCSALRTYYAAAYGVGVSQDRWVGVYQLPVEGQVGIVVADFTKFADSLESTFGFSNKTVGFRGTGVMRGEVRGGKVSMIGEIQDQLQGTTFITMEGDLREDVMEGTFSQRTIGGVLTGLFALVRLTHTSYFLGVPKHQVTKMGQALIDLGASVPGLLGPGRPDAYGPGIHSDATGRPFAWRTDDGQMAFGRVKENAYGLGVGMDQFGRPVRARPLW